MPIGTPFKPGVSGNPAGRPRMGVFAETIREILNEVDPKLQRSLFERLVRQSVRRALQGSYRHLELLLAYGLGRPSQQVNLNAQIAEVDKYHFKSDEELEAELMSLMAKREAGKADKPGGAPC